MISNLQRIWIGFINKSLTQDIAIKKEKGIVIFVVESKDKIAIKQERETKKGQPRQKYIKKRQIDMISLILVETLLINWEKLCPALSKTLSQRLITLSNRG